MEKAIENMRKSGLAKADKKSGRTAAEGTIGIKVADDGKTAAMVDVNVVKQILLPKVMISLTSSMILPTHC